MIMYSTQSCPQCTMLKTIMDGMHLDYQVNHDEELMRSKGIVSIPQLELDDGTLLTFKEALQYLREGDLNGNCR